MLQQLLNAASVLLESTNPFSPIALRGAATTKTSTTTSIVVNVPTGVQNGDFLLVLLAIHASTGGTFTLPSGWTQVDNSANDDAIFYKFASSEPASYTFSCSGTNPASTGTMLAFTNVNPTSPFDNSFVSSVDGANTNTHACPSITPNYNNSAVIGFVESGNSSSYSSWNAPLTQESNLGTNDGLNYISSSVAIDIQTTKTTVTPTATSTGSIPCKKMSFSLRHV